MRVRPVADHAKGTPVTSGASRTVVPSDAGKAQLASMNLLVTGAAQFIGSRYVRTLLAPARPSHRGSRSWTASPARAASTTSTSATPASRFVHGDIRDATLVDKLM